MIATSLWAVEIRAARVHQCASPNGKHITGVSTAREKAQALLLDIFPRRHLQKQSKVPGTTDGLSQIG